ncbi:P-selectin-like [Corticium candelabrum]|uniref:P-selectin-like n=1 Tax=Corticium candelabrum TaxID=121492 RepID=UPI002E262C38|nr:P-selectin-like [Corticium candelabrum]
MTCSSSQVWKGKRPKCQPVYCGELEQPKHGEIIGNNFYFGESVKFSCNRGYMMIGQETSTCEASCTWTNTSPRCIGIDCCKRDVFQFKESKMGVLLEHATKLALFLYFNIKYKKFAAIRFELLQPPKSGFISGRSYTFPNYVVYAIKEGYRLIGASKRNCNASGQWKGLAPNCQRITCPLISNPVNGEFVGDDFSVNSTVEFVCNAGYAVHGSSTSTCLLQGIWSHYPPTCQNIKCATTPSPKFCKVVVLQTHVRSVARYSCSIGYRLVGVTYRQCTQTSQFTVETKWSAKSPKCIRKISIIIPIIVYLLNVYYFAVRCSTLHAPLNEKLLVANSIIHILCCTCVTADTKHFLVTALEMQRNRKMDRYSAIVQRCL